MSNEIETLLKANGYSETDIQLGQNLTRRTVESHLYMTHGIRHCGRCPLNLECYGQGDFPLVITERVTGTGPWNSPLMIVGDIPGELEGKYKTPFVGAEGQLLGVILAKAGVDRNSVYMTYAIKCAATRQPTQEELKMCNYHIQREIFTVQPAVILTVGDYAMKQLNPQAADIASARGQAWQGKEYTLVHTHSMKTLLGGPEQQRYKSEVWQDISLAVASAKEKVPQFAYNRTGLI